MVRSESLMLQLARVQKGVGVALVPEPSVRHYGLVPVKTSPGLRDAADEWPSDELFLVTHRALRQVPRVRVVWDLLAGSATSPLSTWYRSRARPCSGSAGRGAH